MTSKIDKSAVKSAQLKAEVKELEAQLTELARAQAAMEKIRFDTHSEYEIAKADLELGLTGVRKALTTLRDYYGGGAVLMQDSKPGAFMQRMEQPAAPETHAKSAGAGGSIIDILEVVESDFAKNLAKEETEEADAQSDFAKNLAKEE